MFVEVGVPVPAPEEPALRPPTILTKRSKARGHHHRAETASQARYTHADCRLHGTEPAAKADHTAQDPAQRFRQMPCDKGKDTGATKSNECSKISHLLVEGWQADLRIGDQYGPKAATRLIATIRIVRAQQERDRY